MQETLPITVDIPHAAKEGQAQSSHEATQEGQDDTPSDIGALPDTKKRTPCC